MSTLVYKEPYRLPAGILTLVVHGAFFVLLFLGFTWQTQPPAAMQVELWESLPQPLESMAEPDASPLAEKPEAVRPTPPSKPEQMKAPDIALPDKKKAKPKPKPVEKKAEKKKVETKRAEAKPAMQAKQKSDTSLAEQQADREAAQKAAEIDRLVNEYQLKIRKKIRHNIVMSTKVDDDAVAIFRVTLLPGGSVLQVRQVKASGNDIYDSAVERAILKSDPLPLPPDVTLFNRFRELELIFKPGD